MHQQGILQRCTVDEHELDCRQCISRLHVVRHFGVTVDIGVEDGRVRRTLFVANDESLLVDIPQLAHAVPRRLVLVEVLLVVVETGSDLLL